METKEFKYKIGDIIKYHEHYSFHNDLLIIDMEHRNPWNKPFNVYLCETKEHERFWYDEEYLDAFQDRDVDKDEDIKYTYNVGDRLVYIEEVWNPFDDDYDRYEYEVLVKGKKYMPPDHDIYLPQSCYKKGIMYLCEFINNDNSDEFNNTRVWIKESDLISYSSDEDEDEEE